MIATIFKIVVMAAAGIGTIGLFIYILSRKDKIGKE